MEQLSSEAIQRLVQRTGATEARAGGPTRALPMKQLWSLRSAIDLPPPAARQLAAPATSFPAAMEPGLERRLVRRAEALWDTLRMGAALPPASAAAALLRPPFATHAMLVTLSPAGGAVPVISFTGEALLGLENAGHQQDGEQDGGADGARPDDSVPTLHARLGQLGATAIRSGAPAHLDSDTDIRPSGRPQLLLRAVALPLAMQTGAIPGTAARAVVVTSWRKLLSASETADLHRELAAAVDWMRLQRTDR
jgi:hypothetical protein